MLQVRTTCAPKMAQCNRQVSQQILAAHLAKLLNCIHCLVGCALADCLPTLGISAKHAPKHGGTRLASDTRLKI